jgi:hypothetical protein
MFNKILYTLSALAVILSQAVASESMEIGYDGNYYVARGVKGQQLIASLERNKGLLDLIKQNIGKIASMSDSWPYARQIESLIQKARSEAEKREFWTGSSHYTQSDLNRLRLFESPQETDCGRALADLKKIMHEQRSDIPGQEDLVAIINTITAPAQNVDWQD